MNIGRTLLLGSAVVAGLTCSLDAAAYNNREHRRMPDQAYQMMNIIRRGEYLTQQLNEANSTTLPPLASRPAGVPASEQAQWDRFIQEIKDAPDKLGELLVGLPNPRNSSANCGGRYPELAPGQQLSQCRAKELTFAPDRHYNDDAASCYFRRPYHLGDSSRPEFYQDMTSNYVGALLGYYSQAVDDEVNDSVLWIRPQNALGGGVIGPIVQDVGTAGLAIIAAPVACLISLFTGSNCIDDAINLARQVEPVGLIDSAIPGFGNISGTDYTGLWHFINVESWDEGAFNRIGGMHYMDGGWRGGPEFATIGRIDSLDYGIILLGDSVGLSVDPDDSNGVKRYQQDPDGRLMRRRADWLHSIGHIEFEPLDNLALYGWRRFRESKAANGLGWPLHALGDAVAPHHTIAATGWGHRPYEDYAGHAWRELMHEGSPELYPAMLDMLEYAYGWWRFIDDWQQQNGSTDIPIRDMISALAWETNDNDWAYQSGISVDYKFLTLKENEEKYARQWYEDHEAETRRLLRNGIGATLAFLTKAARAYTPTTGTSPCACAPGSGRGLNADGTGFPNCQPCKDLGLVELGGLCVAACPADKPLQTSEGRCVATCPSGNTCTGTACPPSEPFVTANGCSATCDGVVAFGRICQPTCPPGQGPVGGFCVSLPPEQQCEPGQQADATGQCVVTCQDPTPFKANDQCVAECPENLPFHILATMVCVAECPVGTFPSSDGSCQSIR